MIIVLCANVTVTTLIAARIWYVSPNRRRDTLATSFPNKTAPAAIAIIIESGMLYLVMQIIFVVLFAIRHPAMYAITDIAEQITVRICYYIKGKSLLT